MRFLSLFSGIEAASAAWVPLGWEAAAFAEIEPFCCKLLKHHYPHVPNLGDVTKITEAQIAALGPIDVVVFGSPCQDLSCAGQRAGMKGARSGLFFDAMRIVRYANPRYTVWENVPGAFSSNSGRDFAAVLGSMVGLEPDVPDNGWRNSGVAVGPEGFCEWCVLDAQYFGLAQRRERLFLVLHSRGIPASPLLLEPESLQGHPPPRRTKGERAAPTISARTKGGGGLGTDFDCDGGLIVGALPSLDNPNGHGFAGFACNQSVDANHLIAFGGNNTSGGTDVDTCGTLICLPILEAGSRTGKSTDDPRAGIGIGEEGDPMFTLQRGKQHAIAFHARQDPISSEVSMPLDTGGTSIAVAFNLRGRDGGAMPEVSHTASVRSSSGGSSRSYISAMQVRRLTVRECEILMGVPQDYTLIPGYRKPAKESGPAAEALLACYHRTERGRTYTELKDGKVLATPDGPRYRALGNSFAIPVVRWIGERIEAALRVKTELSCPL